MSTDPLRLFSKWTRMWTNIKSGEECWVCHGKDELHIRPVIDPEDTQNKLWEEADLFTFPYESIANTIVLCVNCQEAFDRWSDPRFAFFPADLKFFIDFEMGDREKRRILAEAGYATKRQVPTAAQYRKHQKQRGLVSSHACGGLYRRVFLKQFFSPFLHLPEFVQLLSPPKPWHGNPMASIRRAIAALGSPGFLFVDPIVRRDLERLRDLYFSDWSQSPVTGFLRDLNGVDAQGNKRRLEEEDSSGHAGKKAKEQETEPDVEVAKTIEPTNESQESTNWMFGPDSTANTVVQSYATVLSQD